MNKYTKQLAEHGIARSGLDFIRSARPNAPMIWYQAGDNGRITIFPGWKLSMPGRVIDQGKINESSKLFHVFSALLLHLRSFGSYVFLRRWFETSKHHPAHDKCDQCSDG